MFRIWYGFCACRRGQELRFAPLKRSIRRIPFYFSAVGLFGAHCPQGIQDCQYIVFAIGIKAGLLLLGAFGIANMWDGVFADVGVTVLGSPEFPAGNALRIIPRRIPIKRYPPYAASVRERTSVPVPYGRRRSRTISGTSDIVKFLPRQFGELIFLLIFAPA